MVDTTNVVLFELANMVYVKFQLRNLEEIDFKIRLMTLLQINHVKDFLSSRNIYFFPMEP